MKDKQYQDMDRKNRDILYAFLQSAEKNNDDVSGSTIATMAQFVVNLARNIRKISNGNDWVTAVQILQAQVDELRNCIIELEAYKERLINGVTTQ